VSILLPIAVALSFGAADLANDPDGVVATARPDRGAIIEIDARPEVATPSSTVSSVTQNLSTAEQIDNWLSNRPATPEAPVWRDEQPRKMTGEVSLGIGSHDYSDVSARVDMPLGERGSLSLGFSQTRNAPYYRPVGRDGLFWDPRDPYGEWSSMGLGRGQWVTPSGRSLSPVDDGTLIPRRDRISTED